MEYSIIFFFWFLVGLIPDLGSTHTPDDNPLIIITVVNTGVSFLILFYKDDLSHPGAGEI